MIGINDIKKSALALGACKKINDVRTVGDAINLLQTPQGLEFALKTGFPSLEMWRETACCVYLPEIVLLDMEEDNSCENDDCIIVGDTTLIASYNKPDKLHHIIAMHGSTVEINASNYAVVSVTSINSTVTVKNDGTAIVTVEQSEKGGSQ